STPEPPAKAIAATTFASVTVPVANTPEPSGQKGTPKHSKDKSGLTEPEAPGSTPAKPKPLSPKSRRSGSTRTQPNANVQRRETSPPSESTSSRGSATDNSDHSFPPTSSRASQPGRRS